MTTTSISSRLFNQNVGQAKRAADAGPVVITDRGKPVYVLLRHDAYQRLVGNAPRIRDLLSEPGTDEIEFDPPRFGQTRFKVPELG